MIGIIPAVTPPEDDEKRGNTTLYAVDAEWLAKVNDELLRRGRGSQKALATYCRCDAGQLSRILSGKIRSTEYAPLIAEFTGIPLPSSEGDNEELQALMLRLKRISPERYAKYKGRIARVVRLLEQLSALDGEVPDEDDDKE